jgi:hypothetical protein
LGAVLPHGPYIGSTQGFPELSSAAWTAAILTPMDPTSLEFWEWFYEPGNVGASMSPMERQSAMTERWHADLVVTQDPKVPGTAGEFQGYEGLAAMNREQLESWESISWRPREVHDLGEDRYLVLVEASGLGRGSGIQLEGGEVGHIVKLRDGRAERMDTYLSWDEARDAAGLS